MLAQRLLSLSRVVSLLASMVLNSLLSPLPALRRVYLATLDMLVYVICFSTLQYREPAALHLYSVNSLCT